MAGHTFIPLLGKRIRVTALDKCGRPPAAGSENGFLATDGFASVALTAETEDGTEIISKKADGSLCVNEKLADSFKRFTMELVFCGVNPQLLALVSNAVVYNDYASDPAGFTVPEGTIDTNFAFELWTGLSGAACDEGDEEASGYALLPFVRGGTLADFTVDGENEVSFGIQGAYTMGGNAWGVGPYDVLLDGTTTPETPTPAPLPTALDPLDHLLMIDTGLAPPPSSDDLQPMPAAA